MLRARALNAVLGGCLLWAAGLAACGESDETRKRSEASAGEAATGGNAGSGESSSGGTAGNGESSPGGNGQTGGEKNGTSGGSGAGGDCSDCAAGGSAGATSGTPNACQAKPDKTPNLPEPTSLDADVVARAAVVLGSCIPDDGVARNAASVWLARFADDRAWLRFGTQLDCLANATCGCHAVEQCLGWSYESISAFCTTGCDGSVFWQCGDGVRGNVDCARLDLSCDPEGGCVDGTPVRCTGTEEPTCTNEGNVRFCDGKVMRETPCGSLGFSCVDGLCTGKGDPCSGPSPQLESSVPVGTGCRGDVLEACLGDKATTVACVDQGPGFTCQTIGDAHFCGRAADCVPSDLYGDPSEPSCEGTVLTFCNAGRREQIDCRALGFDGCEVNTAVGHYGCTPVLWPPPL